MANKLRSTNLERFLRWIKFSAYALIARKITRVIVPNWPKWQSLKPQNFRKNDHRYNIFSNLSSKQQNLSNDIKNFRQKWLVKKSKFA